MATQRGKKPLIRFPEFKDNWEHKQLSELLSVSKLRNEKLKFRKDKVLSVSGDVGIVNQIEHLGRSYAGVSVHNYNVVNKNDLVYTKSPLKHNPYGIIRINKGNAGIVSTLYSVYTANKKTAHAPFLGYYFLLDANTNRYLRPLVKKGAKNDLKVNNEYVLNDKIFAPTVAEQIRIASFLSVVDNKLQLLKAKRELLSEYEKGVMQNIFSKNIRFKDNNGKEFPKWENIKFSSVYTFLATNSLSKDKLTYEKGTVKNIHYGDLHTRYKVMFDVTKEEVPFIKKSISLNGFVGDNYCKVGDLIIADASEDYSAIGKSIEIVNMKSIKVLAGLHTILARPDRKKVQLGFGGFLMRSEMVQGQIRKIAQGAKVLGLSSRKLAEIEIELPSIKEQDKIVLILKSLSIKINNTDLQISQLEDFRKGLLQNMFC